MSDVPLDNPNSITVEIRHCCTYVPEGDQWVPAPNQGIEASAAPPVNVDVPAVTPFGTAEVGAVLNCTMGNWQGEPTEYQYRWFSDNYSNTGTAADYVVVASDAGKSVTCVVTATNAGGMTTAPPSNAVTIAPPAVEGASAPPVNPARARREASLQASPSSQSAESV